MLPAVLALAATTFTPSLALSNDDPVWNGPTDVPSVALFAGGDVRERSYYLYSGFVWAPLADLGQETWLLRGVFGGGEYEYNNAGLPGGVVDGDQIEFDISVGYQWFLEAVRFSLYGGLNVQDHDHSPFDPANSTEGSEAGFKAQAELESLASEPFYYSVMGSYSTANDTYWARGRLGAKFQQFTFGPEGIVSGNNEYDGARVGVFGMYQQDNWSVSASVGYADVNGTQGDDSLYGSFSIGIAY